MEGSNREGQITPYTISQSIYFLNIVLPYISNYMTGALVRAGPCQAKEKQQDAFMALRLHLGFQVPALGFPSKVPVLQSLYEADRRRCFVELLTKISHILLHSPPLFLMTPSIIFVSSYFEVNRNA